MAGPAALGRLVLGGDGTLHGNETQDANDAESSGYVFLGHTNVNTVGLCLST